CRLSAFVSSRAVTLTAREEKRAGNRHSSEGTSVPPVSIHQCQLSVPHQCHISVPISATSMPHISAHLSCLSVSPTSASQCHLSMPVSATHQRCQSVPPI
ncbi:unnamed protein product, partial [Staurois parvus]